MVPISTVRGVSLWDLVGHSVKVMRPNTGPVLTQSLLSVIDSIGMGEEEPLDR